LVMLVMSVLSLALSELALLLEETINITSIYSIVRNMPAMHSFMSIKPHRTVKAHRKHIAIIELLL